MRSPLGTFERVNAFPAQTQLDSTCGSKPSWVCERLFEITDGNRVIPALVDSVLTVVVIVLVAWIAVGAGASVLRATGGPPGHAGPQRTVATARQDWATGPVAWPRRSPRRSASPTSRTRDDEARIDSISTVVESTATVIIWTIAGITALGELGVNLAPLIAGAGIAGVALGFGAQSLVKDCIAGLFMLLEDQYGIGDVVDLDEAVGTVEQISLRTTVLRGVDGTVWHVPNGVVQRVGNRSQLWSVALIDVSVAYDCDLAAARQVIIDAATDLCSSDEWSHGRDRPAAAARRRGARHRRHHDPRHRQDAAGRTVGAAAGVAGIDQGRARWRRHRDPVPSAHRVGAARQRGTDRTPQRRTIPSLRPRDATMIP